MFRPAWSGQLCSLGYVIAEQLEVDLGLTLTDEQARRVVDYYALDPETGARLVRRAGLRRPKGAGKSPEGGYLAYAELVLPTQFWEWSSSGQPVGVPHPDPWVQLAAVSEDQTDNVMVWLFDLLSEKPETCEKHGIDLGRSRIYLFQRSGRIEPVTAAAGSREGQRVTFAVLDQTESWTKENGGQRLAATLRRNVGKMSGWSLELQNAPMLGDGSVADMTGKASESNTRGVLFDSREPPGAAQLDLTDKDKLRDALAIAYGEASAWVDLERLVDEIQDPDTDPSDARRYYLNTAAPSSNWAFDREHWMAAGVETGMPEPGALIVAGFDGARHDDSTAIVCADVATGLVWLHAVWEHPGGDADWAVPESEVTAAVEDMFNRWSVWRLYCDPPYWDPTIASWEARFKGTDGQQAVSQWWTNRWRQIGYACRALGSSIRAGEITHLVDEADVLSTHMRNAVRRHVNARDEKGRPLWTLSKPAPGRKIDAAMALVLAWEARTDAIAAGATVKKKTGRAVFV